MSLVLQAIKRVPASRTTAIDDLFQHFMAELEALLTLPFMTSTFDQIGTGPFHQQHAAAVLSYYSRRTSVREYSRYNLMMSRRNSYAKTNSALSASSGRSTGTPTSITSPAPSVSASRAQYKTALLIVDVQNDFLPGGSLAVTDSNKILRPVCSLLAPSFNWPLVVLSQDWHPDKHVSFKSTHDSSVIRRDEKDREYVLITKNKGCRYWQVQQLLWPDHCIKSTWGAAIETTIKDACKIWKQRNRLAYLHKGDSIQEDSYSAFGGHMVAAVARGQRPRTLTEHLRANGIEQLVICGIAMDVCVQATAHDALKNGFRVIIVRKAVRGVDAEASETALKKLVMVGAKIVISSEDLARVL